MSSELVDVCCRALLLVVAVVTMEKVNGNVTQRGSPKAVSRGLGLLDADALRA